ncbi:amidoligase family protein [Nitrincola sp. MINF-07-Sa-05]|uniref:amidoligase family protein n=1 Tax=Nitrincola salilacus TaxID=3400273 RepID=UPI0039182884
MDIEIRRPPWQHNPAGDMRRVGIELEMNGLTLDQLAAIVSDFLGIEIHTDGRYQRVLKGDSAGDWIVELDFNLLKTMGREARDSGDLKDEVRKTAEELLRLVSEPLVPLELVSPPLPLDRLPEVESLFKTLRLAGAKGTSEKASNAFGLQFNPEIPSEDPTTLTAFLKAFLCLYPWLLKRAEINITRRLTNYIDPFPISYLRLVLSPEYWPDQAQLIDDYLKHNPTRNRALDLLPLFKHLDEARVNRITPDPLIKARPTFHYRLPDSEIDQPEWGFHQAWNDWVEVEWMASDTERLRDCSQAFLLFLEQPLNRWLGHWEEEVDKRWLSQ